MMYIDTELPDFNPEDFAVVNFYGKETCFAWNNNLLVSFPYDETKQSTETLKVIKAPGSIKNIRNFEERIFLECYPSGILKLTEKFDFAWLSKSGVKLGSNYYQVFAPSKEKLYLEDKKSKESKLLFPISSSNTDLNDIAVFLLDRMSTEDVFFNKLTAENQCHNNLCLLSYGKNLFLVSKDHINIFYSCDRNIKCIKPVERNGKLFAILLELFANYLVLIYESSNTLKFEKIYLRSEICEVCAVSDNNNKNLIVIIHTDGVNTYYNRKDFSENSICHFKTENIYLKSLKVYKSNYLIYINSSLKEITKKSIESCISNAGPNKQNNFIKLEKKMLKNLDNIVSLISEKANELQTLSIKLASSEDILKRINLFATHSCIHFNPQVEVKHILNHRYLISNFKNVLPKNSIVVQMLKCEGRAIFAMKKVTEEETIVEMPITCAPLSPNLYIKTDLISHKTDGGPWCLIRNYVRDTKPSKSYEIDIPKEKLDLIRMKLEILKKTDQINMRMLSDIKRSIRKEIGDLAIT